MLYAIRTTVYPVVEQGSDRLKELSKSFFGNRHQLEVACAIAEWESDFFTVTTVSRRTGVIHNLVSKIFAKFLRAGVITLVPRIEGSTSIHYSRNESEFWSACVLIRDFVALKKELPAD